MGGAWAAPRSVDASPGLMKTIIITSKHERGSGSSLLGREGVGVPPQAEVIPPPPNSQKVNMLKFGDVSFAHEFEW